MSGVNYRFFIPVRIRDEILKHLIVDIKLLVLHFALRNVLIFSAVLSSFLIFIKLLLSYAYKITSYILYNK